MTVTEKSVEAPAEPALTIVESATEPIVASQDVPTGVDCQAVEGAEQVVSDSPASDVTTESSAPVTVCEPVETIEAVVVGNVDVQQIVEQSVVSEALPVVESTETNVVVTDASVDDATAVQVTSSVVESAVVVDDAVQVIDMPEATEEVVVREEEAGNVSQSTEGKVQDQINQADSAIETEAVAIDTASELTQKVGISPLRHFPPLYLQSLSKKKHFQRVGPDNYYFVLCCCKDERTCGVILFFCESVTNPTILLALSCCCCCCCWPTISHVLPAVVVVCMFHFSTSSALLCSDAILFFLFFCKC